MLYTQTVYRKPGFFWPNTHWVQGLVALLIIIIFFSGVFYAVKTGVSGQLVRLIIDQGMPLEAFLLEGALGYSQPERSRLDQIRNQGMSLSMFLLTGVNMEDRRTFFLSYFLPPSPGPAWLGWAYYPNDPELEGPVAQFVPDSAEENSPADEPVLEPPAASEKKVLVGIYHTHGTESYIGDGGPERSKNENGEIVTIGETLKKGLEKQGINTVHSLKNHDAADFNKAYGESIKTAQKIVQDNPDLRLLLDIHRDGLPYKTTAMVNNKQVSKVLLVIGQKNPDWQKNEQIAKQIIALGEQKFPGLFKTGLLYAADARYNQHLAEGAMTFEIGSQLNTLAEANGAAQAVAEVLAEWLKK
ncbi:MAG: stage II sporulation protein P [Desulfitobacteriaceae bacterium]|nr:stage II sporulation protein P [Desulfitobacteriaceae bacterium]MDD4345993.1 stage II sporulation protein P [Desulfitobacteriaceae bacterium]MDD4400378.1 stage II sporulation protein P [Desulfitobacteriaceae bacterium]